MPVLGLATIAGKTAFNAGVGALGGIVNPQMDKMMTNAPSVSTMVDRLAKGMQVSSLVDVSRPARVNPIVLMEDGLRHLEDISSVLQTICSIFSGYYLQAFNLVSSPNRVETLKVLDSLNPHRGGGAFIGEDGRNPIGVNISGMAGMAAEATNTGLALVGNESYQLMTSMEAGEDKPAVALYEQQNIAVGKLLCLDLETSTMDEAVSETTDTRQGRNISGTANGDPQSGSIDNSTKRTVTRTPRHSAQKVYVMVTVAPALLPAEVFVGIYGKLNKPTNTRDRWQLYRAGIIRARDFFFGCDLIDQHRRLLVQDTSGTYKKLKDNRKKNAIAAIKSGVASLADCSNIVIISSATERRISSELGGKLSSPRVRNIIFEATYIMLLVVVNDQFGQVTIYTRGIAEPTIASIRDLKSYERNKGPDITEILATYVKATAPTL